MNDYQQKHASLGLKAPSILLPKTEYLKKWPVIACDQYTQDRDYWERAKSFADGSPSALNVIFPEVFLSDDGAQRRIENIHSTMKRYLQDGVFSEPRQGFIYIERDTPYQKKRRGLIAAIDLEMYDWHPDARLPIRATEGTVPERLPPRMEIRREAPLELPHILLLIDDETSSFLPSLGDLAKKNAPCYSTRLMMDSGSVTGWFLDVKEDEKKSSAFSFAAEQLNDLNRRSKSRYNESITSAASIGEPFLFAVGDGNHSLAAAKGIWEEYKAKNNGQRTENKENREEEAHPCRYALVEIENIYDPAIQFEPIHRVVFNIGFEQTVSLLSELPDFKCRHVNSAEELLELSAGNFAEGIEKSAAPNWFAVISEGRYALIQTSASGIATACLQPLLDSYAKDNPQLIDYIHDEKEVFRLACAGEKTCANEKIAGILLPPVRKSGLFETVARTGPLPRKSFSMGHSCEKRFYLESRELNTDLALR